MKRGLSASERGENYGIFQCAFAQTGQLPDPDRIEVGIARAGIVTRESLPAFSAFLVKLVLPCLIVTLLVQRGTTFVSLADCALPGGDVLPDGGCGSADGPDDRPGVKNRRSLPGRLCGREPRFRVYSSGHEPFSPEGGQQYIPISSAVDTFFVWTLDLILYTLRSGPEDC